MVFLLLQWLSNWNAGDNKVYFNFGNGSFGGTTQLTSEGTYASGNGKFEYDVPTGFTALYKEFKCLRR